MPKSIVHESAGVRLEDLANNLGIALAIQGTYRPAKSSKSSFNDKVEVSMQNPLDLLDDLQHLESPKTLKSLSPTSLSSCY